MKTKLGILMEGGEEEFLRTVIAAMVKFEHPHYVEVGVAYGETLYGVWMAVKGVPNARVTGIELPTWEGWDCISRFFANESEFKPNDASRMATVLQGRSVEVLDSKEFVGPISVAFIDACHGKPCVMADFEAVEKHCEVGSIVIFHDAGAKEQGWDLQPHCQQPISVRAALHDLRLMANGPIQPDVGFNRRDWQFRRFIPTANQCAVFEKVA
jgi:predicted O-methyltransferase YrrM